LVPRPRLYLLQQGSIRALLAPHAERLARAAGS